MSETSSSAKARPIFDSADVTAASSIRHRPAPWLLPLLTRLHFYVGVLVGPFLLIASLSGIAYALTPQIEDRLYRSALYTESSGPALALENQIAAARTRIGKDASIAAVRPAPETGETTRIMFFGSGVNSSEHRAIFVDPVTGDVRGDMEVYGTGGVLPLRSWIDQFHRGLHLGDVGRLYSELAASWLWILSVGGFVLWLARRKHRGRVPNDSRTPTPSGQRLRNWHGKLGACALLGLLFFSATGLTWSQYAGGNIAVLRGHYGWGTPSVSTALPSPADPVRTGDSHGAHADEHAAHKSVVAPSGPSSTPAMFDAVLAVARTNGIMAGKVEIRPPATPDTAWTVTEIDRRWPTRVDAVSIDPRQLTVVDQVRFSDFPLAAKLTRWGIDAHMGALFGLPNQLVLLVMASCLTTMIVWGYMMWWRRRPTRAAAPARRQSVLFLLGKAPWAALTLTSAVTVLVAVFLPVMGLSLVAFLLLDLLIQRRATTSRKQ